MEKFISNKSIKDNLILYAVTDRHWLNGEPLINQVEEAIKGGASFIQLREKNMNYDDFLNEAFEIGKLCRKYKVPFVINDNVDIAIKSGACGVHVGQSDMEAGDVRKIIGNDMILGVSAHSVEQALLAEKRGASYLGVGAVFPTGTKDDASEIGIETLTDICSAVSIPVVAIGGIKLENIHLLKGTGISGVAVISAIFGKPDKKKAASELSNELRKIII